jgi:hypothetical protein
LFLSISCRCSSMNMVIFVLFLTELCVLWIISHKQLRKETGCVQAGGPDLFSQQYRPTYKDMFVIESGYSDPVLKISHMGLY